MNTNVPLIWYVAISVAFGLLLGYAIGMAIGVSSGKQQLLKKLRLLISRKKLDLDIDKLLKTKWSQMIKEDFLW
jgi:membrane protein DedA with SNARE-associated domain